MSDGLTIADPDEEYMSSYRFYFLIRAYKSFFALERCFRSVLSQHRTDYTILFIDDCSEYSQAEKKLIKKMLKGHVTVFNKRRKYSLRNAYEMIHRYVKSKNAIIISLDGDDWLIRKDVLDIIEGTYENTNCLLTYGNGIVFQPGDPFHLHLITKKFPGANQRYPTQIEQDNTYRKQFFKCLQLLTWKATLFKKIPKEYFYRPEGGWIRFCQDYLIMLAMLELAGGQYEVIPQPLSVYNLGNPLNDRTAQLTETFLDELTVLKQKPLKPINL